ncbi:SixA phosphatase family protein [Limisalsivibrio acetivorans]|uniref:SixA phosphatase family protein n=1 Tax=Limisalsivibrio acetivorans TaxID=1304888 RepID=UPI0003B588FD|nr:histidine phosphatase family protein [Limisalsivibrio acetivorans]
MRQYFIRHGHAAERYDWKGSDLERPLVEKGVTRGEKAFKNFFELYPEPDILISSEAVRSVQTAEIITELTGLQIHREPKLNPGASVSDYMEMVQKYSSYETVAFVGHEPDMSEFISYYISGSAMNVVLKKGSICHVENRFLVNLVQQKVLLC